METDFSTLKNSILFEKISVKDLEEMFGCISAKERQYGRDDFVFRRGDPVRNVYLIVSGSVHIIEEDFWGYRSIIETMTRDTLFGEAYVFSFKEAQLVSVVAAEDTVILEIDPVKLFETCSKGCGCHKQLIKNTLCLLSEKIVYLTEKLEHIMQRNIRGKVLSYLSKCAQRENSRSFSIPYSRQQLADYLCVDRSALSHELSSLREQGVINYKKNSFELLDSHEDIF